MSRLRNPLAGYVLAIAAFAIAAALDQHALRLATKAVPVAVLAVWVARAASPGPFRMRLVFGLVMCALGDFILELGHFVPGLVAFLVGHVGYAAAFTSEDRALRPVRALPFVAFGATVLCLLWGGLGPMALPVTLYTATICTMMWRAAALVASERPWATPIAAGALVFASSDTMIAVNRFHAHFAGAGVLILSTYWIGQALIAVGGVSRSAE